MVDIQKKINELRFARDWSVYRLAEVSGVEQSTLSNMFTRKTHPSLVTLNALCEAFGITLSDFFNEDLEICERDNYILALLKRLNEKERQAVLLLVEKLSENP